VLVKYFQLNCVANQCVQINYNNAINGRGTPEVGVVAKIFRLPTPLQTGSFIQANPVGSSSES